MMMITIMFVCKLVRLVTSRVVWLVLQHRVGQQVWLCLLLPVRQFLRFLAQQQQMQQMQLQVQLAQEQAKLAEIQARTGKLDAEALNRRLEAMYAAMQAAGIAVQQPGVAAAADSALQSGGWKDATPQQPGTGFAQAQGTPQPMPQGNGPMPASPHVGEREGIETKEIQL